MDPVFIITCRRDCQMQNLQELSDIFSTQNFCLLHSNSAGLCPTSSNGHSSRQRQAMDYKSVSSSNASKADCMD
jgi:hypothetical protein